MLTADQKAGRRDGRSLCRSSAATSPTPTATATTATAATAAFLPPSVVVVGMAVVMQVLVPPCAA